MMVFLFDEGSAENRIDCFDKTFHRPLARGSRVLEEELKLADEVLTSHV